MTEMLKELVKEIVELNRKNDKLENQYNELKVRYEELERVYKQEHEQTLRFYKAIREDAVISGMNIEEMIEQSRGDGVNREEQEEVQVVDEEKQMATADAVGAVVNTDVKQIELTTEVKNKTSEERREYMRKYMKERRMKKENAE